MTNLIAERVELARKGLNPFVIRRLPSGWLVIGDVQPLPGYCLLLADPVVESLNSLDFAQRSAYLQDMTVIGDALLSVTDAFRINYETWGNSEPALHTHIMPRYAYELDAIKIKPACMGYSWADARKFDDAVDNPFMLRMREYLAKVYDT